MKINSADQIRHQAIKGALFENMMIAERIKRMYHKHELQTDMCFWRDSAGKEVDLIIQKPGQTEIVEIKTTQTIMSDLLKGLNYYADLEKDTALVKSLVYTGDEFQSRTAVDIVPWKEFGR